MLARKVHERPEQVAELPVVAAALRRWEEAVEPVRDETTTRK